MAHFDSIIDQKQILKRELLKNQEVVNLLVNVGSNVEEFENIRTGSKSPAAKLIKTHFYVPGTTTVDQNFIGMRSRIVYADTDVIKETVLVVYVICNDDHIELLQGSRADLLANEIDKILNNGESIFGVGGIKIGVAEEVRYADGYSGWEIPYKTHEFNREAERL